MLTIIVLYKFKELKPEDEEKAMKEWDELKSKFSEYGVKLISNNSHAFGTSWNGFLVLEAKDFENYIKFWKWFKDRIRWYVSQTQTMIGVKRE